MNDRPPKPVQETMSDEDFAMIVQEMARSPGYREEYAHRKARLNELREHILSRQNDPPEPEEPEPEPVQEMMSDEDFSMIVQEMAKSPGYADGCARRMAAIMEFHELLRDSTGIPADGLKFMRDDEAEEE
ncbi:hypothetical protein KW842_16745 [Duganella sp. sic0402]|uniref:hypothetical protein n=1 Tax=Duganella sp. sic0402 TaxID=2854786 RepID=UPI001C45E8E8|nr:hypothetical protein [Duganella sp. sic0402]MBV7537419.1 hypothetical protein [Duganella sp. sic0402]